VVFTLIGVAGAVPSATTVGVNTAEIDTGLVTVSAGVHGQVATKAVPAATVASVAQPAIGVLLALKATVPASLAVALKLKGAPLMAAVDGCVRVSVGVVAEAGPPIAARPPRAKAPIAR
jgi:hypothetical protein